jgi:xanthine dehydrogenase YagS FAD-binding subunit
VRGVVKNGGLAEITVVLGGVAPVPWRSKEAEDALRGQPVTEALIRRAADAALAGANPLKENGYKADLVFAALRQAVLAVSG